MNYLSVLPQHGTPHKLAVRKHFAYRFKPMYYARKNSRTDLWILLSALRCSRPASARLYMFADLAKH